MSEELDNFFQTIEQSTQCNTLPATSEAAKFIDELINFLFPFRQRKTSPFSPKRQWQHLHLSLAELLCVLETSNTSAEDITARFFETVPNIYAQLQLDAEEMLQNDPAAYSVEEIILAYPGFYAIAIYRLSNQLYRFGVPVLPRIISEHAHSLTGIDIHPGATIGNPFFIDHGTGIVIGETTHIGDFVKIYQGVTLGALSVKKSESDTKRHPTIENNVTIYSNTTILGGTTIVGHDTLIGGNVFLTYSVPPFSTVYHKAEIKVRPLDSGFDDIINFVI